MTFRRFLRLLPIEFSLFAFSCAPSPVDANEFYGSWHMGTGRGQSTIQGDYDRTIEEPLYEMGLELDRENWLFIFDGATASDNRFKSLRLIGGYGNKYIKLGSGFIGVQSSMPTEPGTVAGFYITAHEQDTDMSATSIPLFMRITPYRSEKFVIQFDAYYGLYNHGSITIPIRTIIPGRTATITTKSKKSTGAYGGEISMLYKFDKDTGLRFAYAKQYGQMEAGSARIAGDPWGATLPVQTPNLKFNNHTIKLSFVFLTD